MDIIDEITKENIKKTIPIFIDEKTGETKELKEIIQLIEDNYNIYKEDSIFYKDLFGKTKAINFWVSKKPMVSKIHKIKELVLIHLSMRVTNYFTLLLLM